MYNKAPVLLLRLLLYALVVFLVSCIYVKLTELLNVVSGKQMVSQKLKIKGKQKHNVNGQ